MAARPPRTPVAAAVPSATPATSVPAAGGVTGGGSGSGLKPSPQAGQLGGPSALSGMFGFLGGLQRSPVFQQLMTQPTYSAAPRPVSSRVAVSQPGAVPGAPFEQLLRVLRQAQQGVM